MSVADAVTAPESGPMLRLGVVTQVFPLLVKVGAATTSTPARALSTYLPVVDQVVNVLEQGSDRLVLGAANTGGGWTTLGLASPWVDYGFPWMGAGYRKVGDDVQLRGLVRGGTSGTTIATLPAGYRPVRNVIFTASADIGGGNIFARLDVLSTGVVVAYFPAGTAAYLSIQLSFSTT